jgi:hypothetical protein
MHLQVSNKMSSQILCHLINLVGAAATDTHPTATLIMLWLQPFFSLYLHIVMWGILCNLPTGADHVGSVAHISFLGKKFANSRVLWLSGLELF